MIGRRAAVAVLACLLFAAAARAQLPSSDASLGQAKLLLNAAIAHFSRQAYGTPAKPDARGDAENFKKMRQAIEIFQQAAPSPVIGDALDAVQSTFAGRMLPRPASLSAAIDACERRHDPQLSALVAGNVEAYLGRAIAPVADDNNPQLYGAIVPPRTALELLGNLKFALDHDSVLRDDFYAPENLRRFFGSSGEAHRDPDGAISANWDDGRCRYAAGKRQKESGNLSGGLRLRCTSGPTLDEVVQVFGKPPPESSGRLHYEFSTGTLFRTVDVLFGAGARMRAFDLAVEAPNVK